MGVIFLGLLCVILYVALIVAGVRFLLAGLPIWLILLIILLIL